MRSFASSCATFFALLVLCVTFLGCGGKTGQAKLPGSPKAVEESLGYILPTLEHGLGILRGTAGECARR